MNDIDCRSKVTLIVHDWCLGCSETEEVWKSLRSRHGFSYETVEICTEYGRHLVDKYDITEVPTTIVDGEKVEGVPDEERATEMVRQVCEVDMEVEV
ncbi:MAG: thioredoxin family protein [Halobacteria archaeon]|nr:thioredoxin family protein [Halobacteria archaeon]